MPIMSQVFTFNSLIQLKRVLFHNLNLNKFAAPRVTSKNMTAASRRKIIKVPCF